MTDLEFRKLVADMRAAQRSYFNTRSQNALHHALDLERQVDEALKPKGLFGQSNPTRRQEER